MKSIEKTIMRLISSGFDPDTRSDPCRSAYAALPVARLLSLSRECGPWRRAAGLKPRRQRSARWRAAWRHPVAPYILPLRPPLNPAPPAQPHAAFTCRYRGFIYTSFQERATKISHGNVGKLLAAAGDPFGAKICARIAGDEARRCSRAPSPHAPLPPSAPSRFLPYPTYTLPTPYLYPYYPPTQCSLSCFRRAMRRHTSSSSSACSSSTPMVRPARR